MEQFKILKPFYRGLPIIILSMLLGVIIAKKYLSYVTPMYESTVKLKLADIGEGVPNGNLFKNFDVFASANKIAAEIEVLKSSELLTKALDSTSFNLEIYRIGTIQSVELFSDSPITISILNNTGKIVDKRYKLSITTMNTFFIADETGEKIAKGTFDQPFNLLDNKLIISLNKALIQNKKNIQIIGNYEFEFLSNEKLLEKVSKNLDIISVDKDVPVIRISYKSPVPEKAAIFVNSLAQAYIRDYIDSKYKAANVTVSFLNQQIAETGQKLSNTESNIEDYRNANQITNITQETETDLRKIAQLKIQQTNLRMNLEAIDELNRYINFSKDKFLTLAPNFEAFNDLLSTEIVKNIKRLQAEKKDLLVTYTENDEKVKVIDSKINDLTSYLIESIKNTKINTQIKYDQITKDIDEAEKVFVSVPEKERNMTILNRNFDLVQSSYNFLNEKKIEAEIAQAAKISFHKVISPATVAKKPISPNKTIIVPFSAILAMICSIIIIYSVHSIKAKVQDTTLIEQTSSIPIALTTPFMNPVNEEVFIKHVLTLEMKQLLSASTILTITSNDDKEGKQFHILNFLNILSLQAKKVLLIDVKGDLTHLSMENSREAKTIKTKFNGIEYLSLTNNEAKYLPVEQLKKHVDAYRKHYDLIMVNNENLNNSIKAISFMSMADYNLFTVDSRNTPLKKVSLLESLKDEYNLPNVFFILNRDGYNPNVIKDIIGFISKKFLNKKTK